MSIPMVAGLLLILLMLFCAVYEYLRVVSIIIQLDHAVEQSIQGVAMENWDEVYQGIREGYAGTYTKAELTDDWEEVMNKEQILAQMKKMIEFKVAGALAVFGIHV